MIISTKITPRFDLLKVTDETIKREWFQFQWAMGGVGRQTLDYMHHYIRAHRKRPIVNRNGGDNRGSRSLIENIKLKRYAGQATFGWGIGHVPTLTRLSPHWRVLNYGGFLPGGGKKVPLGTFYPGLEQPSQDGFRGGNWYSGRASSGGKKFTFSAKRTIKPINYIQMSRYFTEKELIKITKLLKASGGRKI